MLKIAFCASLYNKVEDFNLLAELIARHKSDYADRYHIDLVACSTAENVDAVLPQMSRFDHLVTYCQPPLYEGEKRDYVITRKVFQCIRQMLDWTHKANYDYAIFLHSDVYPMDFGKIAEIVETMRENQQMIAGRGSITPGMGLWLDDNILFFDLRLGERFPEMFDLRQHNELTKPMFHYGIHHILPFWMMRYLAPQEFYYFSDCSKNVGYDGTLQGAVPTPLNYDPDLKILHANHHGYWAGEGSMPIISAVKQRLFRENGLTGAPGSETEKFLAMKFPFENQMLRRIKDKLRPYVRRSRVPA